MENILELQKSLNYLPQNLKKTLLLNICSDLLGVTGIKNECIMLIVIKFQKI